MDLQLEGKRALVTGSSAGLGEGTAKVLAREGAIVAVHGRNRERANAVAEQIRKAGGKVMVAIGDLATDEGAKAVAKAVEDELGGVDILVNNAGGYESNDSAQWFDLTTEQWLITFQQNTMATTRMVLALVPGMRERGWGRVINFSTGGGREPGPMMADYCASKAAVQNITMSLSKALARSGITVNCVSPGTIRTERFETWVVDVGHQMGWEGDTDAMEKRFIQEIYPNNVGHAGRLDDIANAVAFLASPLAGFINGANLRVDGGQLQSVN
jgi:NAD(P)-dependent dehydrogenase (short-subunit alcohol dehydrogenase family)